jgi:hypothetical protein
MKNLTYSVLNADIFVIYIVVFVHNRVRCVKRHSVKVRSDETQTST